MTTGKYDTILFDLDGTTLDTLADLVDSVNHVLAEMGASARTAEEIRGFVGNGARKLLERSLPKGASAQAIDDATTAFRRYYAAHCAVKTLPYAGIPELLKELRQEGWQLATVSNKPDASTVALIEQWFPGIFGAVVGQRKELAPKPDAAMGDYALARLNSSRQRCLFIGDSEVDVAMARNLNCPCIAVSWGYRDRSALEAVGAPQVVDTVAELRAAIAAFRRF